MLQLNMGYILRVRTVVVFLDALSVFAGLSTVLDDESEDFYLNSSVYFVAWSVAYETYFDEDF